MKGWSDEFLKILDSHYLKLCAYQEALKIQDDSKRWTQFRTSVFPEMYMVCE